MQKFDFTLAYSTLLDTLAQDLGIASSTVARVESRRE